MIIKVTCMSGYNSMMTQYLKLQWTIHKLFPAHSVTATQEGGCGHVIDGGVGHYLNGHAKVPISMV